MQLAQSGFLAGDLAEHGDQEGGIKRIVGVREPARVSLPGHDVVDPALRSALHQGIEHLLLDVEDVQLATRLHAFGHRERVVAGTWSHLQSPLARLRFEDLDHLPPGEVRPRDVGHPAQGVRAGERLDALTDRHAS